MALGFLLRWNPMELRKTLGQILEWFSRKRDEAIDAAYEGALTIQKLESELFNGEKISYTPDKSKTVCDYAESLRDRQLLKIRFNLAQLKANSFFFDAPNQTSTPDLGGDSSALLTEEKRQAILQKLDFIESVISKYRNEGGLLSLFSGVTNLEILEAERDGLSDGGDILDQPTLEMDQHLKQNGKLFPRLRPQKKESGATYEQQIIDNLRLRREQNRIALRWLAILLIVPLSVQILAKNLIFEPLLGNYRDRNPVDIVLNEEVQEEFARRYLLAKEKIEVATLLGYYDASNSEVRREKLQEAAIEIWREAREEELNGLKNLLADFVALLSFVFLVIIGRKQIRVIRTVLNRSFLNLRDPIKVFLFILVTDIFVGFHSAEGWEVILEGALQHFGLPESKVFINGFIATVPVLIDAVIKFWIFSYLTRYSPSASAIYERMNT